MMTLDHAFIKLGSGIGSAGEIEILQGVDGGSLISSSEEEEILIALLRNPRGPGGTQVK